MAQEGFNRHLALLGFNFAEFRRAAAAAQRYEDLRLHRESIDQRHDIPRRIFEEFYARTQKDSSMKTSAQSILFAMLLGIAALFASISLHAVEPHHTVVSGDAIKWGPAPPSLPPGAQAAVLLGSPAKEGPFVIRLKFPAGFIVPPHRHSKDELVTVISGQFAISSGEKLDRAAVKPLPPASFIHLPAGMPHYALAETESVVQINGVGPFDVTYVDPKDDPRKK